MHHALVDLCTALDALATAVKNAWGSDATMLEAIGWHSPAMTRHDLSDLATQLANDLRSAAPDTLDETLLETVQDFPRRLQLLQANTLPQMFGGNSPQAVPAYVGSLASLRAQLAPLLSWQVISDPKAMPAKLASRVRSIHAEVEQLVPKKEILDQQIADIQRAHAAAESLPVDLQALDEARKTLAIAIEQADAQRKAATDHASEAHDDAHYIKYLRDEAEKTMKLCEEAYRASTTRGLASAFDQRASRLGWSMAGWIAGLVGSLMAIAYLGAERVHTLTAALAVADPRWGTIAMQVVLSVLSVGAPVWLAWLATKQIGQRFRLAEDYSFKASVARAYEGYRKEAARIDPAFEARLFDSALTRLEEPPLRLMETSTHGSPWHELVSSEAFKRAIDLVPELKDKVASLAGAAIRAAPKLPSGEVGDKTKSA